MRFQFNFKIFFLLIGLTAGMLGSESQVQASSCCAGGGGQMLCVLQSEQRLQIGMTTAYRDTLGRFDSSGGFIANSGGATITSTILQVGGAYRFDEDWQFGVTIPVLQNRQKIRGQDLSATQIGDPGIEARYGIWEDLAFLPYRPQLSLYSGLRMPVGTSTYESSDPLGIDVVSEGLWIPYVGVTAQKLYRPFKVTLDASFQYPLGRNVTASHGQNLSTPYTIKSGNRIQVVESLTYLIDEKWSATAGFRQMLQLESAINDASVAGSAARAYSMLISAAYTHAPDWNFSGTFETLAPFQSYAANQASNQTVSVAAVYGGF